MSPLFTHDTCARLPSFRACPTLNALFANPTSLQILSVKIYNGDVSAAVSSSFTADFHNTLPLGFVMRDLMPSIYNTYRRKTFEFQRVYVPRAPDYTAKINLRGDDMMSVNVITETRKNLGMSELYKSPPRWGERSAVVPEKAGEKEKEGEAEEVKEVKEVKKVKSPDRKR